MARRSSSSRVQSTGDRARQEAAALADRAAPYVDRARVEVVELADRAAPYAERARVEVVELVERAGPYAAAAAPLAVSAVESAVETVTGVLEDAGVRGGAAVDVLRGKRVGPPHAVRRWPWAVGAAVAGAVAAAAVSYVAGRVRTTDAPEAVEPEQVQAVVDRPDGAPVPPVPPAA